MAKVWCLPTIASLLICSVAIAQDPPPRISDEGGSKSVYFNLDCSGAGVTCSTSGINATINVPGGGSATFTVEEDNASVDAAVTNLDFLSCFDIASSPAGEANVAFDSGECTVNADALKANGANCSAGSGAGGVDASGAAESCTDYYSTLAELQTAVTNDFHNLGGTDDDTPESGDFGNLTAGDNLTFSPAGTLNVDNPVVANLTGNASTATALAANGANCAASSFPLGVDASGAAESCSTDISGNAATVTFTDAAGDTTMGVALATDATGNLSPRTDAGITYNATTNALTATTFIGALTGNASTATALAANGANCSANSYPLGVDASGAVESCGTNISGNAGTATALAANGANCSAGNYPLGVDASGAVETCTADDDVPESGDLAAATLQVVTDAGKTTTNQIQITRTSANADSPEAALDITATRTETDLGGFYGAQIAVSANAAGAHSSIGRGLYVTADNLATTNGTHTLQGLGFLVSSGAGTGNMNQLAGINGTVAYAGSGTVTTMAGGVFKANVTGGTNTNFYSAYLDQGITAGGTVGTYHGLYINPPTAGTITTAYGIRIPSMATGGTIYPIMLESANPIYFRDANTSINASSSGNLNLHASSDIDSDQTISFPDNEGTRFGTGDDASMYYDGTDLIINPDSVGTGLVRIGATSENDLIADQINICGTALDSLAVMKGSCTTGTARAALNFSLTKTGLNSTVGIAQMTGINQSTSVSPLMAGGIFTATQDTTTNPTGVADYIGVRSVINGLQNTTGGTFRLKGFEYSTGSAPASSTGATVKNMGAHFKAVPTWTGATQTDWSIIAENDIMMTDGHCLYMEGTGGTTLTNGDSSLCNSAAGAGIAVTVDALKVTDFDDDLTQIGDVAAGNYLQIYNATSGTIPEGSWKAVGTAVFAVDGDTPAFCYSGDVDACLQFSTTNSYEFRDLSGTSRFNLDVVNGDIEVGTTARGIDMVTSGNQLTIGRVNAGSIVSGALATTVSQSYQTTDPDVTAYQWTVQTTGTDPTIITEAARITTTDATVTTILTIPIAATSATLIECRIGGIRTGGVAGTAGDGASYVLRCGYRDSAGTTTERTDTIDFTSEDQAGWNVNCAPSGTNALVQVNGAASNNVTWQAWCEYFTVVN